MDPWTETVKLIRDVGFPAVVALLVLRMLRDELRAIAQRLDTIVALLGDRRNRNHADAPRG